MVMDIGQDVLMAPGRERAEPGHALSICVDIGAATNEVSVRPAAAQDDDVQFVGLEVFALRPVLDDGEPAPSRGRFLGEQHFGVFGQPVQALVCVDDFAARRLVGLHPGGKGRVFQVTHTDHAVGDTSSLADVAENDTVLSGAPGVGRPLPLHSGPNILHRGGGQFVQLLPRNSVLNGCNSVQPYLVADVLLASEAHTIAPFLGAVTMQMTPESSSAHRLPVVFIAALPVIVPTMKTGIPITSDAAIPAVTPLADNDFPFSVSTVGSMVVARSAP